MTHKHLAALAALLAGALAPLNAARAGEEEKSSAPPSPHTKGDEKVPAPPAGALGPKAPQDPKIAALVKEMEDPEDAAKRAKAFDTLLALGEPGIAAVKESLSCRGAKIVIESTVTPQSAPPNTPVRIEFRNRNAGTGTLWVPADKTLSFFLNPERDERFEPYGKDRPIDYGIGEVKGGGGYGGGGGGPIDHPLTLWKPVPAGGTLTHAEISRVVPRIGILKVEAESFLSATSKSRERTYPGEIKAMDSGTIVALTVGSSMNADSVMTLHAATLFALPSLDQLPNMGPVSFDIAMGVKELPANESHIECSVSLRNTNADRALLCEENLTSYAWFAWLDEHDVPARTGALSAGQIPRDNRNEIARRVNAKEALVWKLNLLRPENPGTYRLLVGYEVGAGGSEKVKYLPPLFDNVESDLGAAEKLVQARAFALSEPIKIPHSFKTDIPPPARGEPAEDPPGEPLNRRVSGLQWPDALLLAGSLHPPSCDDVHNWNEGTYSFFLRPALLHARTLADADPLKTLIYYHCGETLLRQHIENDNEANFAYARFCIQKACDEASRQHAVPEALDLGCRLALARLRLHEGKPEEAGALLKAILERLEPGKDAHPWDWIDAVCLYMEAAGAKDAANRTALYGDTLDWVRSEYGQDSKAELMLTKSGMAAAAAAKDEHLALDLSRRVKSIQEALANIEGDPVLTFNDLMQKGQVLRDRKDLVGAEKVLLEAYRRGAGAEHWRQLESNATYTLITLYLNLKQPEKGIKFALRALAFQERLAEVDPAGLARTLIWVGACYSQMMKYDKARPYMLRARDLLERLDAKETKIRDMIKNWFEEHP